MAGAICMIKFSNAVSASNSSKTATYITLNINSLGAKPLTQGNWSTSQGYFRNEGRYLKLTANNTILSVYNNTCFIYQDGTQYNDYSDYSDSG